MRNLILNVLLAFVGQAAVFKKNSKAFKMMMPGFSDKGKRGFKALQFFYNNDGRVFQMTKKGGWKPSMVNHNGKWPLPPKDFVPPLLIPQLLLHKANATNKLNLPRMRVLALARLTMIARAVAIRGTLYNNCPTPTAQEVAAVKARRLLAKKCVGKKCDVESGPATGFKRSDVSNAAVCKATFNLLKTIVGAGVLSLPAGVGAIGGMPTLLLPALALVTSMGLLSAYTFFSVGKQCGIQGVSSYGDAWAKTVSPKTTFVVLANQILLPALACLSYTIIMGDSFSALARGGVFGGWLQSKPIAGDRRTWLLAIVLGILYPLCSLRELSALSYTSFLGIMAIAYTGTFMTIRKADGSYLPTGGFDASLPVKPSFERGNFPAALKEFFTRTGTFFLMAQLGTAFQAHFMAPAYYGECGGNKRKFGVLTACAFGASVLFNVVFLITGFLTFGASSQGVVLNNYAQNDVLASVARALFGFSVVFSYPVVFAGLKPVLTDLLIKMFSRFKVKDGFLLQQSITTVGMAAITVTAVLVSNAGVVNGILGAVCGSNLIYIFPALMYLMGSGFEKNLPEKVGNGALIVFGAMLGVLGIYASVAPNA